MVLAFLPGPEEDCLTFNSLSNAVPTTQKFIDPIKKYHPKKPLPLGYEAASAWSNAALLSTSREDLGSSVYGHGPGCTEEMS